MSDGNPRTGMLRGWPVLLALGLVTVLIGGMLGLDLMFAARVGRQTEEILQNSVRSIALVQDIRTHVTRLLAVDLREDDIGMLTEAITADERDHDQLATYPGEYREWTNLQGLLKQLAENLPGTAQLRADRAREIYDSINRLVSINLNVRSPVSADKCTIGAYSRNLS